jgi:hypothetical protein
MKRSSRKAQPLQRAGLLETGREKILKALWSCRRNAIKVSKA